MIGATLVTPSYRHLEKEAVKRFKSNTGLPVTVLRATDKEGFFAKLELDRRLPRTRVVFFDVDAWVVQPTDFSKLSPEAWYAVNDPAVFLKGAFPKDDCENFNIPKGFYFNTGLVIMDLNNALHRKVFQKARALRKKVLRGTHPKPVDWTDQYYLNLAALEVQVPIHHIPFGFNTYPMAVKHGGVPFFPRRVQVVHAAGFELRHKLKALKAMELVFGGRVLPMESEALHAFNIKTFDKFA